MPRIRTIEQVRRELEQKEREVQKLLAKRDKIDKVIAQLTGTVRAVAEAVLPARRGPKPGPKPGRKPAAQPAGKPGPKAGRKPRSGSLPEYIVRVLGKASQPMRAKDIQKAVVQAGYKTAAKDFYGIVATSLRNADRFKRVGRGKYVLVK